MSRPIHRPRHIHYPGLPYSTGTDTTYCEYRTREGELELAYYQALQCITVSVPDTGSRTGYVDNVTSSVWAIIEQRYRVGRSQSANLSSL